MLPLIGWAAKKAATSLVKYVGKKTVVGKLLTGAGVAGVGIGLAGAVTAPAQLPPLPAPGGGAMIPSPGQMPRVGLVPWWRGAGGKLQFPWQDPAIASYLKQFALDDAYLKISYRAPRGYVVVRDPQGRPYAILKSAARYFGLWRAPHKPPISAGDWNKYQTAKRVEKKLVKIARTAIRKHGSQRARMFVAPGRRTSAACKVAA